MTFRGTRITTDISIGNLLTILTFVVGLTVGWQALAAEVQANSRAIAGLDERLTDTEARVDDTLSSLAGERIRLAETLTELRTDLRYLRIAVDRLQGSAP